MNNAHSCHITYIQCKRYVDAGYKKLLKLRAKQGNESHKYSSAPIFDIDVASDAVALIVIVRAKGCQTPYKCTHTYWIRVKYVYNSNICTCAKISRCSSLSVHLDGKALLSLNGQNATLA